MRAFDSDDYRRRVLAVIHRRGGAEHSDPFEIYDIPLDEVDILDDAAVRDRVAEVWAFWQRGRDHPRYRGVIIGLLERHSELSTALGDRTSRLALRDRVAAARSARDDERFAALDAAASRLVARFGGLPADRLDGLRAWAATQGIDEAEFAERVRRHRLLPADPAAGPDPRPRGEAISPAVLRQIRADLDELGRITATSPPRSLFELLGVPPGTPRERIRSVRDAALASNRARRPDRRRALLDDLLAAVGTLLVDGDPDAYLDALAAATTERLRPRVAAAVLVEDALLPAEAATLVADAEADGLDPHRAREIVRALAREHGVSPPRLAPPGRAVPGPAASGPTASGSTASGPVFGRERSGRGPGAESGSAATGARAAGEWRAAVSRARAALRAGRPVEAGDHVATARELAGETLPPIRAMDDEVEAVIRAAGAQWSLLAPLVAAGRYQQVVPAVRRLVETAGDVPGPGGQLPGELLALAESRCQAADRLVASARTAGTDAPYRTELLDEALALVSDHSEALALRAAAAPAPPTAVRVRGSGSSVVVSWQPSVTSGEVRYRVVRIAPDGSARAVGVTASTSLEDGGAPRGTTPAYEVTAGVHGVWSVPARVDATGRAQPAVTPPSDAPSSDAPTRGVSAAAPASAADALAPPSGLTWAQGVLRWTWPAGCTEMMVVCRADAPPEGTADPRAQARKVTNTRYEIDGGATVPPQRPLHVALFACVRLDGRLAVATSAGARLRIGSSDCEPGAESM